MRVSLITVCHRSRPKMAAYVSSFLEHHSAPADQARYQFVFVENSGDLEFQSAVQPLKDGGFDVVVVNTPNDGFGRGCNAGVAHATGDILIFANPDIRFLGDLAPLHAYASQQFWGTVRQITPRGLISSIDLLPENKCILFELLRLRYLINLYPKPFLRMSYVVGSFLIVSKYLYLKSGGFNPAFFLYYEETELARRLQVLSGPPVVETQATVFHEGFGSHNSFDEIFRHEANGFLTYCNVTRQPSLLKARLRTLKLMGLLQESARQRYRALTDAVAEGSF